MEVKLIDGTITHLNLSEKALAHFEDERNCTNHIMGQIKDNYFAGIVTKEDKVILDIGSNIGLFALHFSPFADRIICVEPTPSHMEIQKEILSGTNCEFEEAALSDHTGLANLALCDHNTTMNSLQFYFKDRIVVNSISLKSLCRKYSLTKVDLCKIDIEGSEWVAITEKTLEPIFNIINKIFIEVHPVDCRDEFKKKFEKVGYKVEYCKHDGLLCTK
jgi:FkbM family methyltransferase